MPLSAMRRAIKRKLAPKRAHSRKAPECATDTPKFTLFSKLPIEIRCKIWGLAVSDPRVLQVIRKPNLSRFTRTKVPQYTVVPASYGGHQPAPLSVNRESRSEALLYLKPLWGAYWNFETDIPYLECKAKDDDAITQFAEMRKVGALDRFNSLAIDWMYWNWESATRSMEFTVSFGRRFDAYEHPIKSLNALPKGKKIYFIITDHTLQKDLVKPYSPWQLGPLSEKVCLSDEFDITEARARKDINERREELVRNDQIELLAIHGRKREFLHEEDLRLPTQVWEMDWFG